MKFECNCSKERFAEGIISLGKEEIQRMIEEDGSAETQCHFCLETYSYSKEELEAMEKLQTAIKQLSTGKDDEARKAAADTIQQPLTTQFEADLKQRETELQEVEQRVKSLREQLDKRKAAQADIINLKLQTLINDANGLGFPDTGFASGEPTVQDRAWAPVYPPVRTDETDAPLYYRGQKDSDVFLRDAAPELLQPLKQPLE